MTEKQGRIALGMAVILSLGSIVTGFLFANFYAGTIYPASIFLPFLFLVVIPVLLIGGVLFWRAGTKKT